MSPCHGNLHLSSSSHGGSTPRTPFALGFATLLIPVCVAGQDVAQSGLPVADQPRSEIRSAAMIVANQTLVPIGIENRGNIRPETRMVSWADTVVRRRASRWKWAAIGAGVGGVVGASVFMAGRCSRFKDPLGSGCTSKQTAITIGGSLGGIVGALTGAIAAGLHGSGKMESVGGGAR